LILHHYDFSNFAEKARLMLGFKGLAWQSVEQPPILPKPNTGGQLTAQAIAASPCCRRRRSEWCDTRLDE